MKRSADASEPVFDIEADLPFEFRLQSDLSEDSTSAMTQYPGCLSHSGVLVRAEIVNTVGGNNIDRLIGQRNLIDRSVQELNIGHSREFHVLFGFLNHLVRKIEAVDFSQRSDCFRVQVKVEACSAAELEKRLCGL